MIRRFISTLQFVGFELADEETAYPDKDADVVGKKVYLIAEQTPGIRSWGDYGGLEGFEIDLRKLDPKIKVIRFWVQ